MFSEFGVSWTFYSIYPYFSLALIFMTGYLTDSLKP